jgi:hypothetical protein
MFITCYSICFKVSLFYHSISNIIFKRLLYKQLSDGKALKLYFKKLQLTSMVDSSSYWRKKSFALQRIAKSGRPMCVYCGCDFLRALEINHKNCNRKQCEDNYGKPESGYSFYKRIVDGVRSIGDLEITCGVCNRTHYFQRKFGLNWKVSYDSFKASDGKT